MPRLSGNAGLLATFLLVVALCAVAARVALWMVWK